MVPGRWAVVSKQQFIALSAFRYHLALFLRFSERATRAAGITQTQYLVLLHLRGFAAREWATIGELAVRMQASPHGTVALVNRCVALRLVVKRRSIVDARRVEVHLTPRGTKLVERIAARHRQELASLRNVFRVANVT